LLIICESPSEDEIAKGYPTVSTTGVKIFNQLVRAGMIQSDEKYSYEKTYREFEANGIYITNLVRYQADFGIKGERAQKDQKVKDIWRVTNKDLYEELEEIIKKFGEVKVLFACGSSFLPQLKEVTAFLNDHGLDWFITTHPSRNKKIHSAHYNPQNWKLNEINKTSLMQKIEAYHQKKLAKKGFEKESGLCLTHLKC